MPSSGRRAFTPCGGVCGILLRETEVHLVWADLVPNSLQLSPLHMIPAKHLSAQVIADEHGIDPTGADLSGSFPSRAAGILDGERTARGPVQEPIMAIPICSWNVSMCLCCMSVREALPAFSVSSLLELQGQR